MKSTLRLTAIAVLSWLLAMPATGGVIDSWSGNGNASDGAGPNNGTLVNGVTFGPGVVGQAFQFDGNSYVQAGTTGMPTGNADRTLDLWFKIDSFGSGESFFAGYGSFGNTNSTYHLGALSDGRVFFSQWGNGLIGPSVEAGTWHNLGVTNVGILATLYLDGVAVNSRRMNIDTASDTSFSIGRIPGSLGDSRQLLGSVDEVKLFDSALTADQMLALASVPEPASVESAFFAVGVMTLVVVMYRKRTGSTSSPNCHV